MMTNGFLFPILYDHAEEQRMGPSIISGGAPGALILYALEVHQPVPFV